MEANYYIQVTTNKGTDRTPLKTAKEVIKSTNKLLAVKEVLKECNYKSIEIYSVNNPLPKIIHLL